MENKIKISDLRKIIREIILKETVVHADFSVNVYDEEITIDYLSKDDFDTSVKATLYNLSDKNKDKIEDEIYKQILTWYIKVVNDYEKKVDQIINKTLKKYGEKSGK